MSLYQIELIVSTTEMSLLRKASFTFFWFSIHRENACVYELKTVKTITVTSMFRIRLLACCCLFLNFKQKENSLR